MKALFNIRNVHTGKVLSDEGKAFATEDKQLAKTRRDTANGGLNTDPDNPRHWNKDEGWRVVLGPDHWRYDRD